MSEASGERFVPAGCQAASTLTRRAESSPLVGEDGERREQERGRLPYMLVLTLILWLRSVAALVRRIVSTPSPIVASAEEESTA